MSEKIEVVCECGCSWQTEELPVKCPSCRKEFGQPVHYPVAEVLKMASERCGVNPKDLIGSTKVDLALVPPAGIIACALAMTDGALKYDPYNWREHGKPVQARTYIAAALRHLYSWLDGEEVSADAGVHHLGHAIACCAILLDAMSCDQLVDNRPRKGATSALLTQGSTAVKKLVEAAEARKASK